MSRRSPHGNTAPEDPWGWLKDVAAIVTPLWAFLGAVATPLLEIGLGAFIAAVVPIVILTVLVVVVQRGVPLGRIGDAVVWLGTKLRPFFGGVWKLIVSPVKRIAKGVRKRADPLTAGVLGFVAGVLAVVLALAGTSAVRLGVGWVTSSPCDQPLELRLLTSAENVAALEEAGRRYARESADLRGCPYVRFSVTHQPPLVTMSRAANRDWNDPASWNGDDYRALIAVHPDIWIASSTATADYLGRAFANLGQVKFDRMSPVATSALVVAFTPALERKRGTQSLPASLPDMRKWLKSVGAPLARPRADLSEIGLIASSGLYGPDTSQDISDEIAYTPPDLPLSDATGLLCHARDHFDAKKKELLAMIVPEHLVYAVNKRQSLGACGPGRQGPNLSWYPLTELPALSYPFVRLKWANQWNARREQAVIDFHDWLAQDKLSEYGYRDLAGVFHRNEPMPLGRTLPSRKADRVASAKDDPGDPIGNLIDRLGKAHPQTSLLLLVDESGSMDNPITGGTALQTASSGAKTLLRRLRDGPDMVMLATFSTPGVAGQTVVKGMDEVDGRLGALGVHGSDAPLGDVLAKAAPQLADAPNPVIVMLTDGGSQSGDLAKTVAALAKVKGLRVRLLLTGEQECGAPHIKRLLAAVGELIECAPIGSDAASPYQDQVGEVDRELTKLWRESP
ncbi:vWA domain-containing protein [Nonomuraea sp. NEAU-A123]|uniref:vWA domain-containing protein n=1 Tax=Nonomuraea sp. NEAU-A123 TaxID=2839649 RepID=UPI001BE3D403|nr:vWA domain-containing protein [Nonomuraea sp. NEAU-A123]MBT2229507.1 VWA domain-containing protein [Nonomuraea sp. NEAU-A123]